MGLIGFIKRFFQTRLADLVRQDQDLLNRAIGGVPYQLVDDHADYCRVVTENFTVEFSWMWREQWIDAQITVHEPVDHRLDLDRQLSARDWLEAQGLPTLPPRPGPKSQHLLRDELECVRQVVSQVLSDERKVREALLYWAGRNEGYTDRVLVSEEAPPKLITDWTEERLRLRG